MYTYLINILTAFLNVIGCYCFFETFGKRKPQSKGKRIQYFVFLYFMFYLAELLPAFLIAVKMVIIPVSAAIMKQTVIIKKQALWFVAGWYASKRIGLEVLFLWIKDIGNHLGGINSAGVTCFCFLAYIMLYVFWLGGLFLLKKKLGGKAGALFETKDWRLFFPIPIIVFCVVFYILYKSFITEFTYTWDFYVVFLIGSIVFEIFIYKIYKTLVEKNLKNVELGMRWSALEQRLTLQKDILKQAEHQRARSHDFMNHLVSMNYMAQAKQYKELEKYIASQVTSIRSDWTAFDTKNIAVNAILNTKYCDARDKGIFVHAEYDKLKGLPIENADLSVILGNLMDNAIEAAGACEDDKVIRIKIFWRNQELYIYVSNTHMNRLKCEGDIFYTTKSRQSEEHGYGICNIKDVVEKNNGQSIIWYDESEFVFEIKIPA